MSESSAAPPSVGRQLAQRRVELDIPQSTLAQMAGVTVTSVSKAENDRVAIRRGKRSDWERALRLKPGTISRAYDSGATIEPLENAANPPPYPDPASPRELAVWELEISEKHRRAIIDMLREERREAGQRSAG